MQHLDIENPSFHSLALVAGDFLQTAFSDAKPAGLEAGLAAVCDFHVAAPDFACCS